MNKIPTAEEFVKDFRKQNPPAKAQNIESWMGEFCIEFAKLHVKAALEAALEEVPYGGSDSVHYDDVKGILTCYPENLIV